MRIPSRGQVTIPQELREQAALWSPTEVRFEFDGAAVGILPAGPSETSPGAGVLSWGRRGGPSWRCGSGGGRGRKRGKPKWTARAPLPLPPDRHGNSRPWGGLRGFRPQEPAPREAAGPRAQGRCGTRGGLPCRPSLARSAL